MKKIEEMSQEISSEVARLNKEGKPEEAYKYLLGKLSEAESAGIWQIGMMIIPVLIEYYRNSGMIKEALEVAKRGEKLLDDNGVGKVPERVAIYMNTANIYRVIHELEESYEYFKKAYAVIEVCGNPEMYLSYYNNMAMLHQEAEKFDEAVKCLKKALEIAHEKINDELKTAILRTNLATMLIRMKHLNEAEEYLEPALKTFEGRTPTDMHYAAALSAMADLCMYKGSPDEAVKYFEVALSEIEKHMGRNNFYNVVKDNLDKAREMIHK